MTALHLVTHPRAAQLAADDELEQFVDARAVGFPTDEHACNRSPPAALRQGLGHAPKRFRGGGRHDRGMSGLLTYSLEFRGEATADGDGLLLFTNRP